MNKYFPPHHTASEKPIWKLAGSAASQAGDRESSSGHHPTWQVQCWWHCCWLSSVTAEWEASALHTATKSALTPQPCAGVPESITKASKPSNYVWRLPLHKTTGRRKGRMGVHIVRKKRRAERWHQELENSLPGGGLSAVPSTIGCPQLCWERLPNTGAGSSPSTGGVVFPSLTLPLQKRKNSKKNSFSLNFYLTAYFSESFH